MPLITCSDYGASVSDQAPACPACGRPNRPAPGAECVQTCTKTIPQMRQNTENRSRPIRVPTPSVANMLHLSLPIPHSPKTGLKIPRGVPHAGSTPAPGTVDMQGLMTRRERASTKWVYKDCAKTG